MLDTAFALVCLIGATSVVTTFIACRRLSAVNPLRFREAVRSRR